MTHDDINHRARVGDSATAFDACMASLFSLAPKDFDEDNELPILCETTLLSIRKAHSAAKTPKPTGRIMHVEAIILPRHQTYANTPHDLISLRRHACIISRAETMQAQKLQYEHQH